jgi:hypothetical protein
MEMAKYETKPIDASVKNGRTVLVAVSMRWLPYKPRSEQYRRGIKGRWQVANNWGWENIDGEPAEYLAELVFTEAP